MADAADRAQILETQEREAALKQQRLTEARGESAKECVECDEPIPKPRRLAIPGVQICVECAEVREHDRRHGGVM